MKKYIVIITFTFLFSTCKKINYVERNYDDFLSGGITIDTNLFSSSDRKKIRVAEDIYRYIIDPVGKNDSLSLRTAEYYALQVFNIKNSKESLLLITRILAALDDWESANSYLNNYILNTNQFDYLLMFYKGISEYKIGEITKMKASLSKSYKIISSQDFANLSEIEQINYLAIKTVLCGENEVIPYLDSIRGQPNYRHIEEFYNVLYPDFKFDYYINKYIFIKSQKIQPNTSTKE